MSATSKDKSRAYVTVVNPRTRRGSKSVTVYGMTPAEVFRLIVQSVNDKRKAV